MISFNIGQLACYQSTLHKIDTIYFVGNYVRGNIIGQKQICFAVNFMGGNKVSPRFLQHDGYLGALGAFMREFETPEL